MSVTQLTVVIENAPGKALEVLAALGQAGVNVRAISVVENADLGLLRLVTDNTKKAHMLLKGRHLCVTMEQVLAVIVKNKPGALAKVLDPLKRKKINIDYFYASTCGCSEDACGCGPDGCDAIIILRAKDIKAAEDAIKAAKFSFLKI